MDGEFSVQTFAFNGEEQHRHNHLPSNGGFEPFDSVDDSAGNEIQPHRGDSSSGKLFVGGIAWETTEESFANYFSKYGEIVDSVIMMDKFSGRPRGFGFVTFADPAVADTVLEEDHVIDGRVVEVKRTVPREDMPLKAVPKSRKIFVGGIPPSLAEDELKEYFSFYGSIVEHQIMLDHNTGRSRGFGFVTFDNEDAVEKVFTDGRSHELGGKQVEIKRAVPKRAGGDYPSESKMHRGGYASKSHEGFNRGSAREKGGYSEKMVRGYGANGGSSGGYGNYAGYGNYWGGGYGGGAAGFYGGYGYGFGFGGPMYNAGGYGAGGYGTPMGFGGTPGYGGGKGYGGGGGGGGNGANRGYGNGAAGGYDDSRGYWNGDAVAAARYHPYRK